jgi:hypothetical protein
MTARRLSSLCGERHARRWHRARTVRHRTSRLRERRKGNWQAPCRSRREWMESQAAQGMCGGRERPHYSDSTGSLRRSTGADSASAASLIVRLIHLFCVEALLTFAHFFVHVLLVGLVVPLFVRRLALLFVRHFRHSYCCVLKATRKFRRCSSGCGY